MDNNKIGKLIAELRKKKGLTQQDLGDMVGVGFKAVSKWECGTTLPDITIINEVSKILGITTDELLAGELNIPTEEENKNEENDNKKKKSKLIITISVITILLIFITSLFIHQNSNKTYTYNLVSANEEEYYIDGKVYLIKDNITMNISEILFKNENFKEVIIDNYEYTISINDKFLFGYGYMETIDFIETPISIKELIKSLNINYNGEIKISNKQLLKSDIKLKMKFLDIDGNQFYKELNLNLKNA